MLRSLAAAALVVTLVSARSADATLVFYYDPETGNVAFDTSALPDQSIVLYALRLNPDIAGFEFRPENQVFITQSTFTENTFDRIGEASLSSEMRGYLTVGEILPAGLSQSQWESINWTEYSLDSPNIDYDPAIPNEYEAPGWLAYGYTETARGRTFRRSGKSADFVYGQPDRPYDNLESIVDPETLDWATSAQLSYNPANGEVLIDTTVDGGGYISFMLLESDGGLIPENFTPWVNTPFTTAREDLIGFAADLIEPGVYSAGQILPLGLSLGEVNDTLTRASFIGRFGFGGSLDFDIEADGVDFEIALLSFAPGDFNQDSAVDLLDLEILGRNFGQPGGPSEGDANGDGSVDLLDLDGFTFTGDGAATPIPEPTTFVLLALAAFGGFAHRSAVIPS